MSISVGANLQREQNAHNNSQQLKPGEESHFRIWKNEASPFSYKVMSYMNDKGIPFKSIHANVDASMEVIPNLVGQSIVPVVLTPDEKVLQDSTPIIEWFEQRFTEKTVLLMLEFGTLRTKARRQVSCNSWSIMCD